jgi:predicted DNA-binding transcriptional regulator AlpA
MLKPAQDGFLAEYISRSELARQLGISLRCLSNWTKAGQAPPSVRLGLRRLYKKSSVEAWIAARERASDSQGRGRRRHMSA